MDKKAQLSGTLSWFAAIILIFFMAVIFFIFTTQLSASKAVDPVLSFNESMNSALSIEKNFDQLNFILSKKTSKGFPVRNLIEDYTKRDVEASEVENEIRPILDELYSGKSYSFRIDRGDKYSLNIFTKDDLRAGKKIVGQEKVIIYNEGRRAEISFFVENE